MIGYEGKNRSGWETSIALASHPTDFLRRAHAKSRGGGKYLNRSKYLQVCDNVLLNGGRMFETRQETKVSGLSFALLNHLLLREFP